MNDSTFERAEAERLKTRDVERREKNLACPVEWGNCSDTNPVYWGKPSATPHICSGPATHVRRAVAKLHVCEKCKCIGSQTMPSPYSKAGAQLRAAIMRSHGGGK